MTASRLSLLLGILSVFALIGTDVTSAYAADEEHIMIESEHTPCQKPHGQYHDELEAGFHTLQTKRLIELEEVDDTFD
jgi:hypothetical protein